MVTNKNTKLKKKSNSLAEYRNCVPTANNEQNNEQSNFLTSLGTKNR
jgi:hypothetical protein